MVVVVVAVAATVMCATLVMMSVEMIVTVVV